MNPAGTKVWVTSDRCVREEDGECVEGLVQVVDVATGIVERVVSVGAAPTGIAVDPDGRRVYVANMASDSISVIDAGTGVVTDTIAITGLDGFNPSPAAVAMHPDGSRLYVSVLGGVIAIDTTTHARSLRVLTGNGVWA